MLSLKKWDFDQSVTEQRASKKSKNMIFDFTLLRSVSKFDRGQPIQILVVFLLFMPLHGYKVQYLHTKMITH